MDDLISRQAAIDTAKRLHDVALANWKETKISANTMIDALKDLPSEEPERKNGKWIEQDDGWDGVYYECSVCKEPFTLIDGTPQDNLYNFCPNCGSDMRGEEHEID